MTGDVSQDPTINKQFTECLSVCLKRHEDPSSVNSMASVCLSDINCWESVLNKESSTCLSSCVTRTRAFLRFSKAVFNRRQDNPAVPAEGRSKAELNVRENPYVTCLAKCLGTTPEEIRKVYHECKGKKDVVECWQRHFGELTAYCILTCKPRQKMITPSVSGIEGRETDSFIACFGKCLHLPPAKANDIYKICDENLTCWNNYVKNMTELRLCWLHCLPIEELGVEFQRSFGSSPDAHQGFPGGSVRSSDSSLDDQQGFPGGSVRSSDSSPDDQQGFPGGSVRSSDSSLDDHQGYPRGSVRSLDNQLLGSSSKTLARPCQRCLRVSAFTHLIWRSRCKADTECWISYIRDDRLHCLPMCLTLI